MILTYRPTGCSAEGSERRSLAQNQAVALARLRVNLALEVRHPCPADAPTSLLWQARCRGGKIVVSPTHADFPALLAEALDRLEAHAMDVKSAAAALGCTPSQLTRFLKLEPRALAQVNARRRAADLHPLR